MPQNNVVIMPQNNVVIMPQNKKYYIIIHIYNTERLLLSFASLKIVVTLGPSLKRRPKNRWRKEEMEVNDKIIFKSQ